MMPRSVSRPNSYYILFLTFQLCKDCGRITDFADFFVFRNRARVQTKFQDADAMERSAGVLDRRRTAYKMGRDGNETLHSRIRLDTTK